jgi:hypothetical protein
MVSHRQFNKKNHFVHFDHFDFGRVIGKVKKNHFVHFDHFDLGRVIGRVKMNHFVHSVEFKLPVSACVKLPVSALSKCRLGLVIRQFSNQVRAVSNFRLGL